MKPEELAGNIVALVIIGAVFLVMIGIQAYVCYVVAEAQKALTEEHQKTPPWVVWLMMTPCANVIVNFFVFIMVPSSYQSFFLSRREHFDGNLSMLGIVYSILALLTFIPYLGSCLAVVALIFLILFLVKLNEMKTRVVTLTSEAEPPPFGFGH